MAISLNNHESRIKALESGGSNTWTKGSNSNGFWFKESKTNLIFQYGRTSMQGDSRKTVNLPIAYTVLESISVVCTFYNDVDLNTDSATHGRAINLTQLRIGSGSAYNTTLGWWSIGYLISDRILNYAYACKNLLFTPLKTIGGVK